MGRWVRGTGTAQAAYSLRVGKSIWAPCQGASLQRDGNMSFLLLLFSPPFWQDLCSRAGGAGAALALCSSPGPLLPVQKSFLAACLPALARSK